MNSLDTNKVKKATEIQMPLVSTILLSIIFPFLTIGQVSVEWSNYPGGVAMAVDQQHHIYSANWDYNPGGDITLTKRACNGSVLWNIAMAICYGEMFLNLLLKALIPKKYWSTMMIIYMFWVQGPDQMGKLPELKSLTPMASQCGHTMTQMELEHQKISS